MLKTLFISIIALLSTFSASAQLTSELMRKSANGDVSAMTQLGYIYEKGDGETKDLHQALFWYKKAAERGDISAMYNIACLYDDGAIGKYKDAIYWYEEAIKGGSYQAMHNLGYCYHRGHGVEKNYAKAVELYEKSSKSGITLSSYNMALCYMHGDDYLKKDYDKAFKYFKIASRAGDVDASTYMGIFYQKGLAVNQNTKQAIKYFEEAALEGSVAAIDELAYMFSKGQYGVIKNTRKAQLLHFSSQLMSEGNKMESISILNTALKIVTEYDVTYKHKSKGDNTSEVCFVDNTIIFKNNSSDNKLKLSYNGIISLQIKNNALGVAKDNVIKVVSDNKDVKVDDVLLPTIPAGQILGVDMPVIAINNLQDGVTNITLLLVCKSGETLDTYKLSVQTQASEKIDIATPIVSEVDTIKKKTIDNLVAKKTTTQNEKTIVQSAHDIVAQAAKQVKSVNISADVNTADLANSILSHDSADENTESSVSNKMKPSEMIWKNDGRTPVIMIVPGSIKYVDSSGNNILDAGETSKILFSVINTSDKPSEICKAKVYFETLNLTIEDKTIASLKPGETIEIDMPVSIKGTSTENNVNVEAYIEDTEGLVSLTEPLNISLASDKKPTFEISNVSYSTNSGEIHKMEPINLKLTLKNLQHTTVNNMTLLLILPEGVMLIDGKNTLKIDSFSSNEEKIVNYVIITNSSFNEDVISIKVIVKDNFESEAIRMLVKIPMSKSL